MERKSWVNLRGAAILAVILLHITGEWIFTNDTSFSNHLNLFFNQIARFCVPTFFISSGYGLALKYPIVRDKKAFYQCRMIKILPSYLLWTIIYCSLTKMPLTLVNIGGALLGKSFYHMYFIPALMVSYLLFPFLRGILKTKFSYVITLGICLGLQIFALFHYTSYFAQFVGFLFYFVLGILLATEKNNLVKIIKSGQFLFILGCVALFSSLFIMLGRGHIDIIFLASSLKLSVILYTIGVMGLFLNKFSHPNQWLALFDKESMNIYYFHPLVLIACSRVFASLGVTTNGLLIICIKMLIVSFFSLGAGLIFSRLSQKIKGVLF